MTTSQETTTMQDRKAILSTLWIFAMFNYLYADVYTLFFNPVLRPDAWKELLAGSTGGVQITEGFVLVTAVLMETAMAMVVLSRVLGYGPNRWANIVAGAFHTAFVAWSLTGQPPTLYYAFFAAVEMPCTLFVVWYAWGWRSPKASSNDLPSVQAESAAREGSR